MMRADFSATVLLRRIRQQYRYSFFTCYTDPMKHAAIYARVSTLDRGQDPETQLRQLRAYTKRRGFHLSAEYVDHASGSGPTLVSLCHGRNAWKRGGEGGYHPSDLIH